MRKDLVHGFGWGLHNIIKIFVKLTMSFLWYKTYLLHLKNDFIHACPVNVLKVENYNIKTFALQKYNM